MSRKDQVSAVARVAGITTKQAHLALDAVGAIAKLSLLEDEKIALPGLGVFVVHRRRPRRAMNPSTGVMMDLPASASVKFRPCTDLRDSVKEKHS